MRSNVGHTGAQQQLPRRSSQAGRSVPNTTAKNSGPTHPLCGGAGTGLHGHAWTVSSVRVCEGERGLNLKVNYELII